MRQGKFLLACRLFQKSLTAYELLCERNPGLIFDTEYYKNRQQVSIDVNDSIAKKTLILNKKLRVEVEKRLQVANFKKVLVDLPEYDEDLPEHEEIDKLMKETKT